MTKQTEEEKDPAPGSTECRLGSDRYSVHMTERGTGWSAFGGRLVTTGERYPERDGGIWVYLRDRESGGSWPLAVHPGARRPDAWDVDLTGESVRVARRDGDIVAEVRVAVAPEAAAEVRRIRITNRGEVRRELDVTTVVPVALDGPEAFSAHPAFSRLFLQTRWLPELEGLLARRRPRSPDEDAVSAVHRLIDLSGPGGLPMYETDRARFLGRGRGWASPAALDPDAELSGTTGSVLDPVLALRRLVVLEPGATAELAAVVAAGCSPEEAVAAVRAAWPEEVGGNGGSDASNGPGDPASGQVRVAENGRGRALLEAVFGPTGRRTGVAEESGSVREPSDDGTRRDREGLRFFNGFGGFSPAGDEYVIRLGGGSPPPLPWINVVANDRIGFLVSESGAGYTWAGNSRLNRLTPWFNDSVTDPHGEALYLRDEETGAFWSPVPGPAQGIGAYEARHGFGYSRWRYHADGLKQECWQYVAEEDPVKLVLVRVTNTGERPRRLSAFAYAEWVLGGGAEARATVRAEVAGPGLVLARNPGTEDFGERVAFAAVVPPAGASGDRDVSGRTAASAHRLGFLGPHGRLASPAAVDGGGALEPDAGPASGDEACAALQTRLELPPGAIAVCAFLLGQAGSGEEVRRLVERYGSAAEAEAELARVRDSWKSLLGQIVVETPSEPLDLMMNGWLPYQGLACRLRGRSAFYQSGGAYGYRDQLQDVMGLIYHDPWLARRQILLHAAHQFPEGDVLHWWHPPESRGIRTRFSDDLLWLPYVLGFYLDVTGDTSLLDEKTSFVTGPELEPGEDERYFRPGRTDWTASVYEHACLALDRSLTRGAHALPLMGTGDWNDGMNRVGRDGRGESVWLGFFLAVILHRWIPLCRERGDAARADRYASYRGALATALERAGWDGEWYRRAYYDDGDPIGSSESEECRIDAIAQAWSVLSGLAPERRAEAALDSLEALLVDEEAGLIRLLTPPFDQTPHDPGYIKGYVPGVRENGGQYTHGALWAIRALAEAGRNERAVSLLEMLLPVNHARTPEQVERYQVEPYVVAADVYGAAPHVGRGGWTWYTGSAGWMYRVALESILGFELRDGQTLRLRPCIPEHWQRFRIDYRRPESDTRYRIEVRREDAPETRAFLDGAPVPVADGVPEVALADDGGSYFVEVLLGRDGRPRYRSWSQSGDSSALPPDAITSA